MFIFREPLRGLMGLRKQHCLILGLKTRRSTRQLRLLWLLQSGHPLDSCMFRLNFSSARYRLTSLTRAEKLSDQTNCYFACLPEFRAMESSCGCNFLILIPILVFWIYSSNASNCDLDHFHWRLAGRLFLSFGFSRRLECFPLDLQTRDGPYPPVLYPHRTKWGYLSNTLLLWKVAV